MFLLTLNSKFKIFYFFILITFTLFSCRLDPKNPRINILNSDIHLGNIPYLKHKEFYIYIKNDGNNDLIISNLKSSCKCIIEKNKKKLIIKPTMTDSISLKLYSNSYGNFEETIVILSNSNPKFKLIKIHSKTIK